jgi:hypothetical protein
LASNGLHIDVSNGAGALILNAGAFGSAGGHTRSWLLPFVAT